MSIGRLSCQSRSFIEISMISIILVSSFLFTVVNGAGENVAEQWQERDDARFKRYEKVTYLTSSEHWRNDRGPFNYYCTFRNLWTKQRHPIDYPKEIARWSQQVVYSGIQSNRPWRPDDTVTAGIEKLVEHGYSDKLVDEFENASGGRNHDFGLSSSETGFYTAEENFQHISPVEVNEDNSYIGSVAGMNPSPDWFTGFSSFETINEEDGKYWERFTIQTWPLDAGTDAGKSYSTTPRDEDPPKTVQPITVNTFNGVYASPNAEDVLPVAEWDCVLKVGEEEFLRPECDMLMFPDCNNTDSDGTCDPDLPGCITEAPTSDGATMMTALTIIVSMATSSLLLLFVPSFTSLSIF